jgi:hypothetical protein
MNKNISKIVLSLSAILALNGCGGSSSYKASDNTSGGENTSDGSNNIGLSGYILANEYIENAKVCYDINKDGICGSGEAFVISDEKGYYSFSKTVSNSNASSILLAEVKEDNIIKYVLSSNQNNTESQNITPYTSLVVNEDNYNLKVKNGDITSSAYLLSTLSNLDEVLLTGDLYLSLPSTISSDSYNINLALDNAKNLVDSYSTAYLLNTSTPLLTIASVVDEVVKNNTYSVNVTNISSQKIENSEEVIEEEFSLTNLNQVTSWTKSHADEVVMGSDTSENKIITYSKFHNRLTILDTTINTEKAVLTVSADFLNVVGGEHAVDSVSGATEQTLSKVELSNDGNTIYSLVKAYSDNSLEKGVGIYKSDITTGLNPELFARKNIGDMSFYNNFTVSDISLSLDNSILLASEEDGILLFNANDLSTATSTIITSKDVKSIAISNDNKYIFAGLYKRNASSLGIYSVSSGELLGEYSLSTYPSRITVGKNNDIFVGNTSKKSIYHLDISTPSLISLKNEFTFDYNIKTINLSSDDKYLITATNNNIVQVRDLSDITRYTNINTSNTVNNAFELTDKKIAVTHGLNLAYYKLVDVAGSVTDNTIDIWESTHRNK